MLILNTLDDDRLVDLLKDGKVGVIPTDTVYGLVCSAYLPAAVERLYGLKDREHKPGTIIAATAEQIIELGIKVRYVRAVEHLWPNPISIEIPHHVDYLNQGTGRQGFRVVKDELVAQLLHVVGPLQTTSANLPGKPPANTIKEAIAYFGDAVDFYVDAGDRSGAAPSTLIKIIDDAIEVVRQGSIEVDEYGNLKLR